MNNQDRIYKLKKKIREIDIVLTNSRKKKYSKNIIINNDNWLEIAKKQSEAFEKEHLKKVNDITKTILDDFSFLNNSEKKLLIREIGDTENLKDLLNVPKQYDSIKNKFTLLIITSSEFDPRDTLLELNEIIDLAKKERINYKKIISELIPIADDTNKHGMGSMKDILHKIE